MKFAATLIAGSLMLTALSFPAAAAPPPHSHPPHSFHPAFHPAFHAAPSMHAHGAFFGHDFSHFSAHEHDMWAHGLWRHDWHHGHFGWWFVVDGGWFFYPEPVYPYPAYVGGYYDEGYPPDYDYAPGQYWYYCDDPQGYYPYVRECNGPWRPVPPTPPGEAPEPEE